MLTRNYQRRIRQSRIRKKIFGSESRPRLCVFKSLNHLYVQVIDDGRGKTLAAASDLRIKKGTAKERAEKVGQEIAKICLAKKIKTAVFDRGGYKYDGLIKILADSAREKGLKL